ncbi:hypothetical protein Tco_0865903 [Tanacetum coccineum]
MDKKLTQSNPPTPEKPLMSTISSIPTIEEKPDEHEIAKAKKERAIYEKELEEFLKAQQAHDEFFRMECGVKSESEYETY